VLETTARLQRKRDKVVEFLNKLDGIECPTPDGSFYVFPDIRGTGMNAQEFTDYLMERYGVGVVAGTAFGDRGEGHIRLTYAAPDDVLEEGLDRIRRAVEDL
jgi:aspartate/methionine/tyrosine aminotransferase